MGKLLGSSFPTTYREECLVGKLTRADNFPTTYTDEGLVGKLS